MYKFGVILTNIRKKDKALIKIEEDVSLRIIPKDWRGKSTLLGQLYLEIHSVPFYCFKQKRGMRWIVKCEYSLTYLIFRRLNWTQTNEKHWKIWKWETEDMETWISEENGAIDANRLFNICSHTILLIVIWRLIHYLKKWGKLILK